MPPAAINPIPMGIRIMATSSRLTSIGGRLGRTIGCRQSSKAPVALAKGNDCLAQLLFIKIGPIGRGNIPLRISGLPDQEIADAHFTGCADDQIWIRGPGGEHVLT